MTTTCFPDITNNTLIQESIISDVFSLLEKSNTKKELEDNINAALNEEVSKGTINLTSKEINTISEKLGPAFAALTVCKFQNNQSVSPAELANNILSFLCNIPKFDFSLFKINLNIDVSLIINEILDALLQIVLDILISLLSELMNIVVDLCEFSLDIGFADSVESILAGSFSDLLNTKLFDGLSSALDILTSIFARFGIDFSTGNYIGATDDTCQPAIDTIRPASQFLSSVSSILSSKELCQLLNGEASQITINNIKEVLEFEYPALSRVLNTDDKIRELFIAVGNYVKPDACLTSPQNYENICNFNNLDETKRQLLSARGLTEEQINETIEADNKRLQDKLLKVANLIANLRQNPDSIFDNTNTNLLCAGNKQGKYQLSDFASIVEGTRILTNVVYNRINSTYITDCEKVVESNVKFITKRKYIPRIVTNYVVNNPETGLPTTIEKALNPQFSVEIEGGNKLIILESNSATTDLERTGLTINTSGVENYPNDAIVADYSKIISEPRIYSQLYSTDGDDVLGVIGEFKERISSTYSNDESDSTTSGYVQTRFGLIYSLNEETNNVQGINTKTFKSEPITELYMKRPDSEVSFLTENSLIKVNDSYTRQFDTNKLSSSVFTIGSETRNLTEGELAALENKKAVYTNFSISDGPFRPVEDEIKNIILQEIPSLSIDNLGLSTNEQVFYSLVKDKITTTTAYSEISNRLLNKINDFIVEQASDSSYTNFIDSYFIEGLLRVRREKQQFLDKFTNDPCSLSMDSFGTQISPIATALIEQLIRLFIKNHVIRNVVKNIPFLYYFDPYQLVEKDDSFIEFCLQTLKNEISSMSTESENFTAVANASIEASFAKDYLLNDLVVKDPITNYEYQFSEDEYSLDFKYRYFIKKEFANLISSFRQAYQLSKQGQLPNTFDQFLFSTTVKDQVQPVGLNLVATYINKEKEEFALNALSRLDEAKSIRLSLILKSESSEVYRVYVERSISYPSSYDSAGALIQMFNQLKQEERYKIIINFCFNYSKFLSFNHINELITYSKNYYDSTKILLSTSITIRDLIFQLLNGADRNKEIPTYNECFNNSLSQQDLLGLLPDGDFVKEMFLRLLLEAPFTIIKLLAETFDPNISITNQIRNLVSTATSLAASQQIKLPIFPFVISLWPINFMGWGPPMSPYLGIPYLIVDTIQTSLALANIRIKKEELFANFQISVGVDISIENPREKDC